MRYSDAGRTAHVPQRRGRLRRDTQSGDISICASDVAALGRRARLLMELQRRMARENSVIMDGRDIGLGRPPGRGAQGVPHGSAEGARTAPPARA